MADVQITPRIRCDNCGLTADKEFLMGGPRKPRRWGALTAESGRGMDGYPAEHLRFIDLCPSCATGAHDAAAARLKELRAEPSPERAGG